MSTAYLFKDPGFGRGLKDVVFFGRGSTGATAAANFWKSNADLTLTGVKYDLRSGQTLDICAFPDSLTRGDQPTLGPFGLEEYTYIMIELDEAAFGGSYVSADSIRWRYFFVESVERLNRSVYRFTITLDPWMTYHPYMKVTNAYIERRHCDRWSLDTSSGTFAPVLNAYNEGEGQFSEYSEWVSLGRVLTSAGTRVMPVMIVTSKSAAYYISEGTTAPQVDGMFCYIVGLGENLTDRVAVRSVKSNAYGVSLIADPANLTNELATKFGIAPEAVVGVYALPWFPGVTAASQLYPDTQTFIPGLTFSEGILLRSSATDIDVMIEIGHAAGDVPSEFVSESSFDTEHPSAPNLYVSGGTFYTTGPSAAAEEHEPKMYAANVREFALSDDEGLTVSTIPERVAAGNVASTTGAVSIRIAADILETTNPQIRVTVENLNRNECSRMTIPAVAMDITSSEWLNYAYTERTLDRAIFAEEQQLKRIQNTVSGVTGAASSGLLTGAVSGSNPAAGIATGIIGSAGTAVTTVATSRSESRVYALEEQKKQASIGSVSGSEAWPEVFDRVAFGCMKRVIDDSSRDKILNNYRMFGYRVEAVESPFKLQRRIGYEYIRTRGVSVRGIPAASADALGTMFDAGVTIWYADCNKQYLNNYGWYDGVGDYTLDNPEALGGEYTPIELD